MQLGEIGARLIGTFISLFMGGLFYSLGDEPMNDSKLLKWCAKLGGLSLIIGGLLVSWFWSF